MKLRVATLADRAWIGDDGNLNIMGVHNGRVVRRLPIQMPVVIALVIDADPDEWFVPVEFSISVLDEDGQQGPTLAHAMISPYRNPGLPAGTPTTAAHVAGWSVTIDREGVWTFVVTVGKERLATIPFYVRLEAPQAG